MEKLCGQVPVIGFSSGSYDLSLIKSHFADRLANTASIVKVAKNGNKIMFVLTWAFVSLTSSSSLGRGPTI